MDDNFIDFGALVDEAMHSIVKKSLEIVVKNSLPGDHHFFISFLTSFPGVQLSERLKNKYPDEMTIVLQHQYEDLIVEDYYFSVSLSFDNIKEKIVIPFDALTAFADPSVKFGLQFRHLEELPSDQNDFLNDIDEFDEDFSQEEIEKFILETEGEVRSVSDNIISLDNFRKTNKKPS